MDYTHVYPQDKRCWLWDGADLSPGCFTLHKRFWLRDGADLSPGRSLICWLRDGADLLLGRYSAAAAGTVPLAETEVSQGTL